MLQDMERGRSLELDAIVGAVIELSEITGVAAPTIRNLYALTRLKAETRPRAIAPFPDAPHPRPIGTRPGV
jgi:2-dehydropantoate 2-reductase